MKTRMFTILFVIPLYPFLALSQEDVRLQGKVVDHESGKPMSYASVSIKGKAIGTVTNDDGIFDFYIPASCLNDTLTVSVIGYATYKILVSDAMSKNLSVKLKIKPIMLKEVKVMKPETGQQIMLKAFQKIEQNFPTKNYNYRAFFRELYEENNEAVFMTEAVVDIYDVGFHGIKGRRNWLNEKVHTANVRSSTNYFKSAFKTLTANFSYLTYCLQWRNIKYRDPNPSANFKHQKFEVDSMIALNNELLFVVSSAFANKESKSKDTYYVNAETYAIHKHVISDLANSGQILNQWKLLKDSSYFYQNKSRYVVQEYENLGGKMYLKYVTGEFQADIYDQKTKSILFKLKTTEMLSITEINANEENVPENLTTVLQYKNLSESTPPYDAKFWNNYNVVKQVPLTRKQVRDLEKKMPLEEQYKSKGNKAAIK